MKKLIPILLLPVLFISCSRVIQPVRYMGSSYPPSEKEIDVFVDPSAIRRPYIIMGKGYLTSAFTSPERIQHHAVEQARKHGADAVLFLDNIYYSEQTAIRTTNTFDTTGRKTRSSTIAGPVISREREIQFLKYD